MTADRDRARGPAPARLPADPHWLAVAEAAVRDHGAIQKAEELGQLLELLAGHKPERVVEIGADRGGTLFAWSQLPGPPRVLAVDLPTGDFRAHKGLPALHGADLVIGDSRARSTFSEVSLWLDGEPADVLFIDTDHTYRGVSADFANYRGLVREGGLVVFHDILIHPHFAVGVSQLWEEIRDRWPSREIISEPLSWGGIGVLTYSAEPLPRPGRVRVRRSGS